MDLNDLLGQVTSAGVDALSTAANKAILGTDAAEKIALRQKETDTWGPLGATGPNDRAGAAADAAKGPIWWRNPFGSGGAVGSWTIMAIAGIGAVILAVVLWRKFAK